MVRVMVLREQRSRLVNYTGVSTSHILTWLKSTWSHPWHAKRNCETPREKTKLLDTGLGNDLSGRETQSTSNKDKNKDVDLCQTEKLLHSKGSHEQNEKATREMGEII